MPLVEAVVNDRPNKRHDVGRRQAAFVLTTDGRVMRLTSFSAAMVVHGYDSDDKAKVGAANESDFVKD